MEKKDLDIWIRNLSDEEKKIMQLRFGLNGEEPFTLKEISLKLGIKVSKVNLLEIKSIQKGINSIKMNKNLSKGMYYIIIESENSNPKKIKHIVQ